MSHEKPEGNKDLGQEEKVKPLVSTILVPKSQRAGRAQRRETMAKIEESCKKLSDKIDSKFSELNVSLSSVSEKIDKFQKQQNEISATFLQQSIEIKKLKTELDQKEKRITDLETQMQNLQERVTQQEVKYGDTEKQFVLHSEMITHQNDQFEKLDHDAKSHRLIIKNIPESNKSPREDIDELFGALKIQLTCEKDCDRVYRMGRMDKQRNAYPRPILVELTKATHKGYIYASIGNLKTSTMPRVIIDNDQSAGMQRQSSNLRAVASEAKRQGMRAHLKPGKVIINDTQYQYEKIGELPPQISIESLKTIEIPEIGIGYQGEFSPLSNMFKCEIEYDEEIYKTAEHALVGTRARVEGNTQMEAMVKFTSDPFLVKHKAKRWEKSVQWQAIEMDIHEDILFAKFSRNPNLKSYLLNTKKKLLFECTMDRTYGIGFSLGQRHKIKKNGNPGKNLHGKACMKIRSRLRDEEIAASVKKSDSEDSE